MIQPGLERIGLLLKDVQFPWKAIHVAGTNGKGSICNYASALLTRKMLRTGRFTSPHIIDRWDSIAINDKPIDEQTFKRVENHFIQLNERENIRASEFELLTATAFQIFNEKKVDVGVVEVGMGGKLDATNILNNQVVSVISKIARDHMNFLGDTIEEIALHKAGILRPNVPYIVNPVNEWNVHDTISRYAEKIGAGPKIHGDTDQLKQDLFATKVWHKFAGNLEPFRRDNAVLAYLAVVEALKSLNLSYKRLPFILEGIRNKQFPGRFQRLKVKPVFGSNSRDILLDGAHNTDAAIALREHVGKQWRTGYLQGGPKKTPVTWVLAMTEGKDAYHYLGELLKPGDSVVTTSFGPVDGMPWVKPMDPRKLLRIATEACPGVSGVYIPEHGPFRALCAAKYLTRKEDSIVMTGSLYLVGDFLRERVRFKEDERAIDIKTVDLEERSRVNAFLSHRVEELDSAMATMAPVSSKPDPDPEQEKKIRLEQEIRRLNEELKRLDAQENSSEHADHTPALGRRSSYDADFLAAVEPTPDHNGEPSVKQKFFNEFEDIRRKLLELPGALLPITPDEPLSNNDLRDMVKNVEPRPDVEGVMDPENPTTFKIRAHLVASPEDEFRFTPRVFSNPEPKSNFDENASFVRRIVCNDQSDLVRKGLWNPPPPIRPHYAGVFSDDDDFDRTEGKKYEITPKKGKGKGLVHHRSDTALKANGLEIEEGVKLRKFVSNAHRLGNG